MTRGGRTKDRDGAMRTCIVTRTEAPKASLLRFVVGPENILVPDIAGKLPGRGIYVLPELSCVEKAAAKGLFSRAAKSKITVGENLANTVTAALTDRLVKTLSLARKAGEAIAGFEKVKALLVAGDAAALIQASDGSEAMKSKLRAPNGPESYVDCLTSGELGVAFGRDTVIHAALTAGGLADLCLLEAKRLRGLRAEVLPG